MLNSLFICTVVTLNGRAMGATKVQQEEYPKFQSAIEPYGYDWEPH